jgi:hypothetical protein
MTKVACRTDRCPAESGGSHGRSAERSVAGSPDFFAKRSAVGSHVGIAFPRRLFCARRSHRLRAQAELHSALRSDTPPSAVVSGPIMSRPDPVQGRHILLLPERMSPLARERIRDRITIGNDELDAGRPLTDTFGYRLPQQRLNFWPLPQGQRSFRPTRLGIGGKRVGSAINGAGSMLNSIPGSAPACPPSWATTSTICMSMGKSSWTEKTRLPVGSERRNIKSSFCWQRARNFWTRGSSRSAFRRFGIGLFSQTVLLSGRNKIAV